MHAVLVIGIKSIFQTLEIEMMCYILRSDTL